MKKMNNNLINYFAILVSLFFALMANLNADEERNNIIKQVELASRLYVDLKGTIIDKRVEINLEHPRIYIGKGYSSGYEYKGVNYPEFYTLDLDGLSIRIDSSKIIVNNRQFPISDLPKSIWISDDLKVVKIDQKICDFKKITNEDIVINKEILDKIVLDNGYTLEIQGGYSDSRSGIGITKNHCILARHGIVLKVWGDSLYVWGAYYGKLSEIANKSKTIRIDFINLLEK